MVEYGLNTDKIDKRGWHIAKKYGVNPLTNPKGIKEKRRKESKKWLDGSECPRVLIDSRELNRPKCDKRESDRVKFLTKKLDHYGFQYEIKQLEIGDYVCRNTVIEYKLAGDFVGSITDKEQRMKKESINQANSFRYHYVFIVGDLRGAVDRIAGYTGNYKRYDLPLIWSNIAKLEQYTRVMMFPNDNWAYECMLYLFKYNNKDQPTDLAVPVSKFSDNPAYNYLRVMNGVGGHRAGNIVNTLEVETLVDLLNLNYKDLLTVHGIGSTIAKQIITQLGFKVDKEGKTLKKRYLQ